MQILFAVSQKGETDSYTVRIWPADDVSKCNFHLPRSALQIFAIGDCCQKMCWIFGVLERILDIEGEDFGLSLALYLEVMET